VLIGIISSVFYTIEICAAMGMMVLHS